MQLASRYPQKSPEPDLPETAQVILAPKKQLLPLLPDKVNFSSCTSVKPGSETLRSGLGPFYLPAEGAHPLPAAQTRALNNMQPNCSLRSDFERKNRPVSVQKRTNVRLQRNPGHSNDCHARSLVSPVPVA